MRSIECILFIPNVASFHSLRMHSIHFDGMLYSIMECIPLNGVLYSMMEWIPLNGMLHCIMECIPLHSNSIHEWNAREIHSMNGIHSIHCIPFHGMYSIHSDGIGMLSTRKCFHGKHSIFLVWITHVFVYSIWNK